MRAVVLDAPRPPRRWCPRAARPPPRAGLGPHQVKAFGLNRSELKTRLGLAARRHLPARAGDRGHRCRRGLPRRRACRRPAGRRDDGRDGPQLRRRLRGVHVRAGRQAIPFRSELPWTMLGAVPEMLQTAYGALTVGLDAQPGQTLLIRGGTSSVGLTAAILAKRRGLTVLATTRHGAKAGACARWRRPRGRRRRRDRARVRELVPGGVDARSSSSARRRCATAWRPRACTASPASRVLSNQWIVPTSTRSTSCPTACA